MPTFITGSAPAKAFAGEINFAGGNIRVTLHTSALSPNQDTLDYFDDVASTEVTGTGYVQGGKVLQNPSVQYDAATNTTTWDGDDLEWANSTLANVRYAVLTDFRASTNATRPVVGVYDFGTNKTSDAAPFTVTWGANGIFRGSVA